MDANLLMSGKTQYAAPTPADADVIPLSITSGGRIRTDVTGTVSITGTVTVTGTVAISGTPTVSISGTPAVTVSGTATVAGTVAVSGVSGTVATSPVAANGTNYALTTTASTNAASIKSSGASLFEITVFNSTAATIYVRLYNKSSAPTVGTDIPIAVIPVAASAVANLQFGHIGKRFGSGLAIAVTAAAANTDATVVTAGALISATYL